VLNVILTILFFIILEVLFAQFTIDLIMVYFEQDFILLFIILGLDLVILTLSIIVSIMLTEHVEKKGIYKAGIMAYFSSFLFMLLMGYITLYLRYPQIFNEVTGIEILLIFPQIIVYFTLYILQIPILFFILTSIVYSIFFIIFLTEYYEYKPHYYKKRGYE